MNKPSKSSVTVLALSIILGFSLLFNVIQATTPDTGPYYLSIPTSTWAFQIGKFDNGTYYAVNGANWHVDYTSTNASEVVNNAIGDMPTGGHLFIQKNDYTFVAPILIEVSSITIEMEKGTVIWANFNDYLFKVGITASTISLVTIRGGELTGGASCLGFVLFNNVKNSHIEQVNMHGLASAECYTINFTSSWANYVDSVTCWNVQNGIWIGGAVPGYFFITDSYLNAWDFGAVAPPANYEINLESGGCSASKVLFEGNVLTTTGINVGWIGALRLIQCAFEGGTHLNEINFTSSSMNYKSSISETLYDRTAINIPVNNLNMVSFDDQQNSEAYSYVVWGDGTNYFLGNGTTGQVDYQSTSAVAVVNAVWGNATNGESILFKEGTYNIAANPNPLPSFISVWGEGSTTVFNASSSSVTAMFTTGSNILGLKEKIHLENFKIEMNNNTNAVAVSVYNCKDSLFRNLYLRNYVVGFNVKGDNSSYYSFWNRFENIFTENNVLSLNSKALFNITSMAWDSWIDGVHGDVNSGNVMNMSGGSGWWIEDAWVTGTTYSYVFNGTEALIDGIWMSDCYIDTPDYDGIVISAQTYGAQNMDFGALSFYNVPATYNNFNFTATGAITRINTHDCTDNTQLKAYIAIHAGAGSFADVNFYDNHMKAGASGAYYNFNLAYNTIRGDIAYITEMWGTNSTAVDGGIQGHGLSGTPFIVTITSGNSTAIICGVGVFTSTTFTYYLHDTTDAGVSGQTVYWYATMLGHA